MKDNQCNHRTRDDGPWHRCMCKTAYIAIDRRGREYSLCRFHAKEMRSDPRILRVQRVK